MTLRTATASIDLSALHHNYQQIQTLAPQSKILAVLKANAYGHGLTRIAKALPQADAFGVARINEAINLRNEGIKQPIVLLGGFFSDDELTVLCDNQLQTIVHNHYQLDAIVKSQLTQPLKVWLKIDTGMHRLGIAPEQFEYFYQSLSQSKNVQKDIVLMSHFGCADEKENLINAQQIKCFEQLTQHYRNEKSLANSAAVFAYPQSHYQWLRPGLSLYGVSPFAEQTLKHLQPVMTLQSSLIAIRDIEANEAVGYGSAWISNKKTTIGVVAIGYGDGYPRHAKNGTPVLINGRRVPLVGRVAMDMITVDLGNDNTDNIGDIVTLWGAALPVEEIAACATTIPYELLCNISRRVDIKVMG